MSDVGATVPGAAPSTAPVVAVVGGGDAGAADRALAREVGAALAARGAAVDCGGLGGVMAAACAGARDRGGVTIGLLPGTDRSAANPDVQVAIPTGLGEARNTLVVRAADAVIAVGGRYGTLSEIAFALATGVPVVGLGTWELRRGGRVDGGIRRADGPQDAVDTALELAGR